MRTRIDWKYALGLELEDEGFDFSVLCEFRARLLDGHGEYLLFETMVNDLKQRGLRHPQEDDNEPMPRISWRQCVLSIASDDGEKRCAQHSICWQKVHQSGFAPLLPMNGMSVMLIGLKSIGCPREKRSAPPLVETIGADGSALLDVIFTTPELDWLRHIPAVEILRRVWVQQFEWIDGKLRFRADENIPPPAKMICSPYDTEATYGRKLTSLLDWRHRSILPKAVMTMLLT